MKKIIFTAGISALTVLAANAQFQPKHLAVLRAGDGVVDLHLKQSPAFIDQFTPGSFNPAPSYSVSIPTNGPETLFFNGHAATEGILARSADHHLLSLAGYGGVNLLQDSGTPALLDIGRAFCTVNAAGKTHTTIYRSTSTVEKMNPRGVATDGTNNFWGCGNALGTVYFHAGNSDTPVAFADVPSSRAVKIIGNTVYVTLNGADASASGLPAGISSFADHNGSPAPLPRAEDSVLKAVVKVQEPYSKIAGFDMNPDATIAYTADTAAGIQKYVKSGGDWKFAYNFSIPQNIPAADNHANGCFALAVDFSGSAPIIYATTTEGYNGCVSSNRVVQIVDTSSNAVVTTIAQAPSAKIAYRGIDFTPEP
jgi:hypothetical protein